VRRLTSFERFYVRVFDSPIYLEPVERFKNMSIYGMKVRNFGDSTSSRVKDKLKVRLCNVAD